MTRMYPQLPKLLRKVTSVLALGLAVFIGLPVTSAHAGSEKIPRVLSDQDIARYREIIALQADAKWKAADTLIKRLDNDILLGHLMFQRYMHPTGYRSKYTELRSWMKAYADHPGAWRIYNLALKRRGRMRRPNRPEATNYPGISGQSSSPRGAAPKRSKAERQAVRTFRANVRRYVGRGKPERAEKRWRAIARRSLLTPQEEADSLERIAASHYYNGNDRKAQILASRAVALNRAGEPGADWIAALSAWRMGETDTAYDHFAALTESDRAGSWLTAGGHYWAARSALLMERYDDAHSHLLAASEHTETFYGLIARRQLGLSLTLDWSMPNLNEEGLKSILKHTASARAIALTEIGRDDLADEELRLLWGREGSNVQNDLLPFASALNLPATQLRIGRSQNKDKPLPAAVRYPLPEWEPVDGLRVDRAMLYAMVRQESDFRSRARSAVGARGLMQVMPATASFITRDRSLFRRNRNRLYEPEFNMALGQQYVEHLMGERYIEGNLFMLLAAYNGGPGSLINWKRDVSYGQDPLLFIESIGFFQTRHYIERVMTNLWLYRLRLGQPTPSLDAVVGGAWPTLEQLDSPESRAIQDLRRARLNERTRKYYDEN